ncbi:hypothetical protein EYF80_041030 [Liparis tanakae]|uniref:Uncharacterized protein n=1 Tax=Liparis tanakae TaxID=230148 RepID=A0A4Z2G6B9_9TELE|nr:hypothetical protein EYF80_041030 [Liparis tanakae]
MLRPARAHCAERKSGCPSAAANQSETLDASAPTTPSSSIVLPSDILLSSLARFLGAVKPTLRGFGLLQRLLVLHRSAGCPETTCAIHTGDRVDGEDFKIKAHSITSSQRHNVGYTPRVRDRYPDNRDPGLLCAARVSAEYRRMTPGSRWRDRACLRVPALYSQADTPLILPVFSVHGCRFCRANSELFCRHSGSGVSGWLMVFWKASCCSCMRIRLACCRSASRSSAVLTWASVIFRALARAARSADARYFCRWKRFSSSQICSRVKDVRGFFFFGGVLFW